VPTEAPAKQPARPQQPPQRRVPVQRAPAPNFIPQR
jgi:hypothetical protein